MKQEFTREEMKRSVPFLRTLTYNELLEAHRLIDKGADVALLYFWFNLIKGHYRAHSAVINVLREVEYYCRRNPDFETEIRKWYRIHESNNHAQASPA